MHDEESRTLSPADADEVFRTGDTRAVVHALLGIVLAGEHEAYAWGAIRAHLDAEDAGVRGVAILCIGHMARQYGRIDGPWARDAIARAHHDTDAFVRGHAHSAASDIEMFGG